MTRREDEGGLEAWWDLLREEWARGDVLGETPSSAWAPARARPAALRRLAEEIIEGALRRPDGDWPRRLRDFVRRHDVPVDHPRHFGHFNPDPSPESILARALAGSLGSQLAVRPFAPAAVAFEAAVLERLREGLGLPTDFSPRLAAGGAETLRMVLLAALQMADAGFAEHGLRGRDYRVYRSAAGHLATDRAVRATGLGQRAVAVLPTDDGDRLDPEALLAQIRRDRRAGRVPLAIIATFGSTVAGAVDPVPALRQIAGAEGLWLHVDAAWGGAARFDPKLRGRLPDVVDADSFQLDLHKWPAIPQSLGLLLLRHEEALNAVTQGADPDYFPRRSGVLVDPFQTDLDWSRPARGPEILAALAAGEGLPARVARMGGLGDALRERLRATGWRLRNDTPLPLVCFDDPEGRPAGTIRERLRDEGEVWLTEAGRGGRMVLRACLTGRRTRPEDLDALVEALERARAKVPAP